MAAKQASNKVSLLFKSGKMVSKGLNFSRVVHKMFHISFFISCLIFSGISSHSLAILSLVTLA